MEAPGELVFEEEAIQKSIGVGRCTGMVGVAVDTSFLTNSQFHSLLPPWRGKVDDVSLSARGINSEALLTIGKQTLKKKKKTLPRVKNVQLLAGKVHGAGSSASPSASQPEWRESGGPAEIEKRWQRSRSLGAQLLPSDLVSLGKWSKVQHKYVGYVFNMGKRSSLCVVFLPAEGGWILNTNRKDRLAWRARTPFFSLFLFSGNCTHWLKR